MKKTLILFVCVLIVFPCYSQADSFYSFSEVGPFSFVCPSGFYLLKTENDTQTWTNGNGSAFNVWFEYIPEWAAAFRKTNEEALAFLEHTLVTMRRGTIDLTTIEREKSGGCYKIRCISKEGFYYVAAVCPDGLISVLCDSKFSSDKEEISKGIYQALSYLEYK